jgi:hypothetical protein
MSQFLYLLKCREIADHAKRKFAWAGATAYWKIHSEKKASSCLDQDIHMDFYSSRLLYTTSVRDVFNRVPSSLGTLWIGNQLYFFDCWANDLYVVFI